MHRGCLCRPQDLIRMNRPGRSGTGRGTKSVAPSLFESNRAGGGAIAASRRSGTRELLLILPLIAFLTVGCSLCIAMAETPDSDGAVGETFTEGDYTFKILSESSEPYTVEIKKYNGSGGAVTINPTVENGGTTYKVVSIGAEAFRACSGLTSIDIKDGIQAIGDSAFSSCSGLTLVVIPGSVASIGTYAFYGCSELTSIVIPESVTSIGTYTFGYCSGLTSIVIPESVTSIGEYAFSNCSELTSINIPRSVTSIEYCTFHYCNKLTSINIPGSVTSIGELAFNHCIGLTSIVIPGSVTSIKTSAFNECSGLTSIVIEDGIQAIGASAFYGCSGLTSVVIPKSVTSIGDYAFYQTSLTSIRFEEGIGTVNDNAFGKYDGGYMNTKFYKEDGVTQITLASDSGEIGGMLFKGDLSKMIRQPLYTVTFDFGDGITDEFECYGGDSITLPGEDGGISKPGYALSGWQISGEGDVYEPGTAYTVTSDTAFTAVWTPFEYTVTYYDGSDLIRTEHRSYGDSMTLPGEDGGISKSGYALSGWQISGEGDVYEPGTEYTVTSDVTFTAVWEAVPSPSPSWDDDDDWTPTKPSSDPDYRKRSDESTSILIIVACVAAFMAILTVLVYSPKR